MQSMGMGNGYVLDIMLGEYVNIILVNKPLSLLQSHHSQINDCKRSSMSREINLKTASRSGNEVLTHHRG